MAIEVYQGNYSGSEIDAAIADVGTLNGLVPTGASSSNKLATASDITGITDKIPSGASSSNKLATASDISSITEKIPASASSSNQLATMSDIPSTSGIAGVQINGVDLTPDANDKVNIPVAGTSALGVIKTSTGLKTDIITEYMYTYNDSLDDIQISEDSDVYKLINGSFELCGQINNVEWEDYTYYYDDGSNYNLITRTTVSTNVLAARTATYYDYVDMSYNAFISKGTLDNVLTATIGDIQSIIQGVL